MKFKEKMNQAAGFTLVELIVVIAILAILAGVAVPAYSGYITQANKSNDETLASEIKNALMLAYYNGTLKPGASVIVYYDGTPVKVDGEGADQAMKDAFGENYATSLKLSWDGWEMGTAADSVSMGYVNGSSFDRENLGTLLSQVDTVVSAATSFFVGQGYLEADADQWIYLNQAGVSVPNGEITTENASAIANATVFAVANNISKTESLTASDTESVGNLIVYWGTGDFSGMKDASGWDMASIEAANYASTVALAAYVDKYTRENYTEPSSWTSYSSDSLLNGDQTNILDNREALYNNIMNSESEAVQAALEAYMGDGDATSPCYKDAMAFLAYMQGVSESASSMIGDGGLNSSGYFENNIDYVTNYVSLSDVLINANVTSDAIVFFFDGSTEDAAAYPLDYMK